MNPRQPDWKAGSLVAVLEPLPSPQLWWTWDASVFSEQWSSKRSFFSRKLWRLKRPVEKLSRGQRPAKDFRRNRKLVEPDFAIGRVQLRLRLGLQDRSLLVRVAEVRCRARVSGAGAHRQAGWVESMLLGFFHLVEVLSKNLWLTHFVPFLWC